MYRTIDRHCRVHVSGAGLYYYPDIIREETKHKRKSQRLFTMNRHVYCTYHLSCCTFRLSGLV